MTVYWLFEKESEDAGSEWPELRRSRKGSPLARAAVAAIVFLKRYLRWLKTI